MASRGGTGHDARKITRVAPSAKATRRSAAWFGRIRSAGVGYGSSAPAVPWFFGGDCRGAATACRQLPAGRAVNGQLAQNLAFVRARDTDGVPVPARVFNGGARDGRQRFVSRVLSGQGLGEDGRSAQPLAAATVRKA